jgi:RNA polymerase subunit RPABC4/transcription elongation factor Spt4
MEQITVVPATERTCPFCSEMIRINAILCKYCKKELPALTYEKSGSKPQGILMPDEKKCWHCGTIIKKSAKICRNCQKAVEDTDFQTFSIKSIFDQLMRFLAPILALREMNNRDNIWSATRPQVKSLLVFESWLLHLFVILACISVMVNMVFMFQEGAIVGGLVLILELMALGAVVFGVNKPKSLWVSITSVILMILGVSFMMGGYLSFAFPGLILLVTAYLSVMKNVTKNKPPKTLGNFEIIGFFISLFTRVYIVLMGWQFKGMAEWWLRQEFGIRHQVSEFHAALWVLVVSCVVFCGVYIYFQLKLYLLAWLKNPENKI